MHDRRGHYDHLPPAWRDATLQWEAEHYPTGQRMPQRPERPPAQRADLLGVAAGLTLAGVLLWPLGAAALLVLRRWRRYSPRPESWARALAGTLTVLAFIQLAMAIWIGSFLLAAHI